MRYVRDSHALNDDIPLNSPLYEALPSKVIRAIRSDLQQEISAEHRYLVFQLVGAESRVITAIMTSI
jgi:hypothetical protein